MTAQAFSDADLVRKCQTGEWRAYNELVARHQDRLFNLVYRYLGHWQDACDVCQEVFLKAYRALPEFRGEAVFGTWLHRIGINTLLSWQRQKRVRGAVSLDGGGDGNGEHERGNDPPADAPGPLQVADRNETQQLVQDGINSLDDEQRMVVILRDIEGYDYEEIARMLDCPRGTVKSRLHRARLVLRERLRPLFQPEEERT